MQLLPQQDQRPLRDRRRARERLVAALYLAGAPRSAAAPRRAPRGARLPPGGAALREHDRLGRPGGAARSLPRPLRRHPQDQPRGRRSGAPRGAPHRGGAGPLRRDPALARALRPLRSEPSQPRDDLPPGPPYSASTSASSRPSSTRPRRRSPRPRAAPARCARPRIRCRASPTSGPTPSAAPTSPSSPTTSSAPSSPTRIPPWPRAVRASARAAYIASRVLGVTSR